MPLTPLFEPVNEAEGNFSPLAKFVSTATLPINAPVLKASKLKVFKTKV